MSVLITGANGYIAQHIIQLLLNKGYNVIGTVRSEEKRKRLINNFQNHPSLQIVILKDLTNFEEFKDIFISHSFEVILHTASPVKFDVTDLEKDIINPAVLGTKNILKAIVTFPQPNLRKFVITSSTCAIEHPIKYNFNKICTEYTWSSITPEEALINSVNAYYAAKTFAERYAWDFYKKHSNNIQWTMCSVNPDYVLGPKLFFEDESDMNYSLEIIDELIDVGTDYKVDLRAMGRAIDVRDVAEAHIAAFERKETIGKRLVLSNQLFSERCVMNTMWNSVPALRKGIPSPQPESTKPEDNVLQPVNYSATRILLNTQYIDLETTIKDTAEQLLANKYNISAT